MIACVHRAVIFFLAVLLSALWPTGAEASHRDAATSGPALTRKTTSWPETRLNLGHQAFTDKTAIVFFDGNGNITAVMDTNANVVARAEYDAFGRTVALTGPMAAVNHYWFSSKEYIPAAGLYNFGGRFYDLNPSRWLNRDPIGEAGGINLYTAMGNNLVCFIDPDGLAPGDWWDARTYFNSGFIEGWSDAANAIGQSAGGSLAVAFDSQGLNLNSTATVLGANPNLLEGELGFIAGTPDVSDSAYGAITGFDPTGLLPIDPNDPNMENAAMLGMAVSMLDGAGEAKAAKKSLSKCKKALEKVHDEVGKLPKGKPGKFGSPQRGTPQKGYRLDPPHPNAPPNSPESQPHINWWDYTGGKKGSGGRYGAVPIQ